MRIKKMLFWTGLFLVMIVYGGFLKTTFDKTYSFGTISSADKQKILFSENAFYYSFYERLNNAEGWGKELLSMRSNDRVMYPEKVNVLTKYNIFPEIFGSAMYRIGGNFLQIDSFDFYIWYVIIVTALGVGALFLLAHETTGSVVAGYVAVLLVLFSYPFSSRVVGLPALRENFGIPLLIAQIYFLVRYLKYKNASNWWLVAILSIFHIWAWQFSTYTLLIEVMALLILYLIEKDKKTVRKVWLFLVLIVVLKIILGGTSSGGHVVSYLKFQLFKTLPDFHVLMYHCNGGFGIISSEILNVLFGSQLLVLGLLGGMGIFFIKSKHNLTIRLMGLIALGYAVFGMLINRFVVLAIPFVAVISGLIFSNGYLNGILGKNNLKLKKLIGVGIVIYLLMCWMFDGSSQVWSDVYWKGNPQFVPEVEPYKWIRDNTEIDSVFGANMMLTSKILLFTGRRIANNPYYEDSISRQKTWEIYRMYGRESEKGMSDIAHKNDLDYLVVDRLMCYGRSPEGCLSQDLYVNEDADKAESVLCQVLGNTKSKYFELVFSNNDYRIFKVL